MKIVPLILLFCLLLIADCLSAQYDPSKISKKLFAIYMQAMEKANSRDFNGAIDLLNQCISTEPKYVDAFLSLGGVYGQLKNYKSSTDNYEKAFAIDSNYTNEYKLPYSIDLAGQGRFQEALNTINALLNSEKISPATRRASEVRQKTYEFAVDYASKHSNASYQFTPVNLGDSINTPSSEYYPSITINDSLFVFTRRGTG